MNRVYYHHQKQSLTHHEIHKAYCIYISQCKMQTADCRLQTADCRLQTGGKMQTEGKMQTADCRPGIKCRLRVK